MRPLFLGIFEEGAGVEPHQDANLGPVRDVQPLANQTRGAFQKNPSGRLVTSLTGRSSISVTLVAGEQPAGASGAAARLAVAS
jgi:hypothetical protein